MPLLEKIRAPYKHYHRLQESRVLFNHQNPFLDVLDESR